MCDKGVMFGFGFGRFGEVDGFVGGVGGVREGKVSSLKKDVE